MQTTCTDYRMWKLSYIKSLKQTDFTQEKKIILTIVLWPLVDMVIMTEAGRSIKSDNDTMITKLQ